MKQTLSENQMYEALVNKDPEYEGTFFAAIKTTGIFCRPTCTARKPKKENVEYYLNSKEALDHGYRPCKVCKPLQNPGTVPEEIQGVLEEIERTPLQKISDWNLKQRGLDPARFRRWFIRNHNMTFHAYQRLIRVNTAFNNIKSGEKVIEAAFDNGYNSLSGFNYYFKKTTGINPRDSVEKNLLTITRLDTPIGPMFAIACDDGICLLEFSDRRMLETELKQLSKYFNSNVIPGNHKHFELLKKELKEYFEGSRSEFSVPLVDPGTEFQRKAWKALMQIPYGQTISYANQAESLGKGGAVRATGSANGNNRIAIIIPCHRVIGSDGDLKGYGGGLWRKKWLIEHEKKHAEHASQ